MISTGGLTFSLSPVFDAGAGLMSGVGGFNVSISGIIAGTEFMVPDKPPVELTGEFPGIEPALLCQPNSYPLPATDEEGISGTGPCSQR